MGRPGLAGGQDERSGSSGPNSPAAAVPMVRRFLQSRARMRWKTYRALQRRHGALSNLWCLGMAELVAGLRERIGSSPCD